MKASSFALAAFVVCGLATSGVGQAGLGAPGSYLTHSSALIGNSVTVDFGFPGSVPAVGVFGFSGGYGPTVIPGLGTVWLDLNAANYGFLPLTPDASGNFQFSAPIGNDPSLFNVGPVYCHALVADPSLPAPGYSITKTVAISFDTQDGYRPVGNLATARSMHAAVSLSTGPRDDETRVLIIGGGTGSIIVPNPIDSIEIYNPMKRAFEPGPTMSIPRARPQALRLQDGRVLISGGVTNGGAVTSLCEIFDPATNSLSITAQMTQPRVCHAMTLLPSGEVLVTGGLTDWSNAGVNFVTRLNTSQDSAEIFDPVAATWTPVASPMSARRTGHAQHLLPNGLVLIAGGVTGGTYTNVGLGAANVPTFTSACQLFDPVTRTFAPTGNMITPRAFFGSSRRPDGTILVTGGCVASSNYGAAAAGASCESYDPATGAWTSRAALATARCFHSQLESKLNGDAIVMGGFTGDLTTLAATSSAVRHVSVGSYPTQELGRHTLIGSATASPLSVFTVTPLYDGRSYLVAGGVHTTAHSNKAWIVWEN